MSRRARAVAFLVVALGCAALAATIADGYGTSVAQQYGELRPVLVATADLPPSRPIDPRDVGRRVEVRQVPSRFVPPDALAAPEDAVGREPVAPLPAGSYLLSAQLRSPRPERRRAEPKLGQGRRPVQISVTGAAALAATGGSPKGTRVDVVVTSEPNVGGRGRTFVAAEGVELLALSEGAPATAEAGLSASDDWSATLALTRSEALQLIQAQNFARQVTLIPH
jgi:Flp pilus assembly protein CpaB